MKTNYIAVLLLASASITYGQTAKTYSGEFEKGKATYQYYENEKYDRIFHGPFSYNGSLYDMTGHFTNGKRDGEWKISSKEKKFTGYSGTIITNSNISGSYNNGNLEGDWSYENSLKFDNSPSEVDKETSKAKFKNNHFVENITYESSWPEPIIVEGQFDDEGFMSGTWIYRSGSIKDEIRFNNGVSYWRVTIDTTNGDKQKFVDNSNFVQSFWDNFDAKGNLSIVGGKTYYLDTVSINSGTRVPDIGISPARDPFGAYNENYNPIFVWSKSSVTLFYSSSLSNPLYYYNSGCNQPKVYQKVIMECDYGTECYKKLKAIETSSKIKSFLNTGDSLFNKKLFKDALANYKAASELDNYNTIIRTKLDQARIEMDNIETLHKTRTKAYITLIGDHDYISLYSGVLNTKLTENKKKYGENYAKCISFLKSDYESRFSKIDSLITVSESIKSEVNYFWTDIDQEAYEEILNFKKNLEVFDSFYHSVKVAFESYDTEKLKMLKSDNEPKAILDYFKSGL